MSSSVFINFVCQAVKHVMACGMSHVPFFLFISIAILLHSIIFLGSSYTPIVHVAMATVYKSFQTLSIGSTLCFSHPQVYFITQLYTGKIDLKHINICYIIRNFLIMTSFENYSDPNNLLGYECLIIITFNNISIITCWKPQYLINLY